MKNRFLFCTIQLSKGKPLDRYGLRVRPEKEIPNENAWIVQAFIIFMAKLFELRKLSKEFYKAHPHSKYLELQQMTFFIINMFKKYVNDYINTTNL